MKSYGKCHLCGKQSKLTFEHIAQQKVYNDKRIHTITGETMSYFQRLK